MLYVTEFLWKLTKILCNQISIANAESGLYRTSQNCMSCIVFHSYLTISSSRKQRIFNVWGSLWYWVSGYTCTMHKHMLTSELLLFSQSRPTMSLNEILQPVRITLLSTNPLFSMLTFYFFLSMVLCINNLKCICSLDISKVELDHQMLCFSFIAEGHFVRSRVKHSIIFWHR